MAGKPTLQDIFVRHFDDLRESRRLSAPQRRAGDAIVACRTETMGGHEQRCPDGHFVRTQYHSCKHRSCPTCAEKAKGEWLEKEEQRLLPCDHFHVIFTVSHELIAVWRYNRREFTAALFGACRDTLLQLLGQERHLGATPGILMALHTWGRTLNEHPHVHCLVSAGGMALDGVIFHPNGWNAPAVEPSDLRPRHPKPDSCSRHRAPAILAAPALDDNAFARGID